VKINHRDFKRLFIDSADDYDLAESFGFFVEDYILPDDDSHIRYVAAIRGLPDLVRKLYLAFITQVSIESSGFLRQFQQFDAEDLRDDAETGYKTLGKIQSLESYQIARKYFEGKDEKSLEDIPEVYETYFSGFGEPNDFWTEIGKYLRKHKNSALNL